MTIEQIKNNNALTLKLTGRLDSTTAPDLEAVLNSALDGIDDLVIDLEGVSYVSSAGLRLFVMAQKRMLKQGKLALKSVCPDVKDVLEITGFLDFLTVI